jgi:hypothetical protein
MGRAADSLERTCHPLEPKSRSARRKDSELSRRGFGEASSGARLFLRNVVPRNRATHDLPLRPDRNGLEHVANAIRIAPSVRTIPHFCRGTFSYKCAPDWLLRNGLNSSLRNSRTCSRSSGSCWRWRTELNFIQLRIHAVASQQFIVRAFFCYDASF